MKALTDDKLYGKGARRDKTVSASNAQNERSRQMIRNVLNKSRDGQEADTQTEQATDLIVAKTSKQNTEDSKNCVQPTSMDAVISGPFLGNLSVSSYRPNLVGWGFWTADRDASAGPFDTGAKIKNKTAYYRAGVTVQLIGQIPISCRDISHLFSIRQLVRKVFPREAIYRDDLDDNIEEDKQQKAPFRQEFALGKSLCISFCDAPSIKYGPNESRVLVREWESSINGPQYSKVSVIWQHSISVDNGTVKENKLEVKAYYPK